MTDLCLERDFPVPADRLYAWLTNPEKLLKWWGPEGVQVTENKLDFSCRGPWYSVMRNSEGDSFKVSGQVTKIDPGKSVGFTWAWHDDNDQRGTESHVMFTVARTETGSKLILDHRDLDNGEQSANHEMGWTSSLRKLTATIH